MLAILHAALADRRRLVLEHLALRQQVAVLRRGVKRPKLEDKDRIFWIAMLRTLNTWRRKPRAKTTGRPAIGWDPQRSQSWPTFLANHMDTTVACDFFTVPTGLVVGRPFRELPKRT